MANQSYDGKVNQSVPKGPRDPLIGNGNHSPMHTNSSYDGKVNQRGPKGPRDPLIGNGNHSATHTDTTKPHKMAEAQADRPVTNSAVFFP